MQSIHSASKSKLDTSIHSKATDTAKCYIKIKGISTDITKKRMIDFSSKELGD